MSKTLNRILLALVLLGHSVKLYELQVNNIMPSKLFVSATIVCSMALAVTVFTGWDT